MAVTPQRFIFAGNRAFVLDEMFAAGLNVVAIGAVPGSYLERELLVRGAPFTPIPARAALLALLAANPFDCFVSNGCPYVLPVEELCDGERIFVNVHPSYLPDLRGADPVPGALLFGRAAGATCHVMDAGVDTGPIVSQVEIPYSEDLDAGLLYQLSFAAEREAFAMALERGFAPIGAQPQRDDAIYYTRRPEDLQIDFARSAAEIVRRVRAFGNRSQGAYFLWRDAAVKVYDAEIVRNPYALAQAAGLPENAVVFAYEDSLLVNKGDACVKLKRLAGDFAGISAGTVLA